MRNTNFRLTSTVSRELCNVSVPNFLMHFGICNCLFWKVWPKLYGLWNFVSNYVWIPSSFLSQCYMGRVCFWWWPTLFLSWWCCSHWIDVTCSCAMIVSIDFAGVWRQSCQMPVEFFDATCPDLRCFFRSVMPDVRCQMLSCFMPDWSKDFFRIGILRNQTVSEKVSLQCLFAANFSKLFMCNRSQSWVMIG